VPIQPAPAPRQFRTAALWPLITLLAAESQNAFQERVIHTATGSDDLGAMNAAFALSVYGPLGPAQIADAIGTGRSNASKILKRLLAAGLVVSEPDTEDLRAKRIALTPAGQAKVDGIYALIDRMMADFVGDWPPERVARFADDLEEFTRRFQGFPEWIDAEAQRPGQGA
jgi:DNA-binding MarR family transcriptional regulator